MALLLQESAHQASLENAWDIDHSVAGGPGTRACNLLSDHAVPDPSHITEGNHIEIEHPASVMINGTGILPLLGS